MVKRSILYISILSLLVCFEPKDLPAKSNVDAPGTIDNVSQIAMFDATNARRTLGTIKYDTLEKYALIKDSSTKKDHLYKRGDYINDGFRIAEINNDLLVLADYKNDRIISLTQGMSSDNIEFIDTLKLDTFEYRYWLLEKDEEVRDKGFEFVKVEGSKAILEKSYKEESYEARQAVKEGSSMEEFFIEDSYDVTSLAQNNSEASVDEVFFNQLKTKKMGNDVWMVDGESVSKEIVNDTAEVLKDVTKAFKGVSFGSGGIRVNFKAKSGNVVLDRSGFLVDSLTADVKSKAGFLNGDIIKTINNKAIYNFTDMAFMYFEIMDNNISQVQIKLLRENQIKTQTYLIN
ncbi:MAG: hypothetical protein ABH848_03005 [Candidatus Omnitrophota bacterium]